MTVCKQYRQNWTKLMGQNFSGRLELFCPCMWVFMCVSVFVKNIAHLEETAQEGQSILADQVIKYEFLFNALTL